MPIEFLLILVTLMGTFVITNFLLRRTGKPVPVFGQYILIWLAAYSFFKFILFPPIPVSLLYTYMGLITIVLFIFVSATEASWTEFKRPIANVLMAETPTFKGIRTISVVALPLLIGYTTYGIVAPKFEEPIELRTVHPAPPASTTVHGKSYPLQTTYNPFRIEDDGKPLPVGSEQKYFGANAFEPNAPKYLQYAKEGGAIFFQNCHFCHGDNLNGRGMFAFAFNPIPANFSDPGTIAQLQETFVFWRVSKGGPGLPREGFPWASAMPPWEQHLTTDEIWKVVMFEYWHTNFYPRTWE